MPTPYEQNNSLIQNLINELFSNDQWISGSETSQIQQFWQGFNLINPEDVPTWGQIQGDIDFYNNTIAGGNEPAFGGEIPGSDAFNELYPPTLPPSEGQEGGGPAPDPGMGNLQVSQANLGISSGAVGSRTELQRMLESYKGRSSLIQSPQRQKSIFTIDRFDGGINLNKSPRDLSYWEACHMDELSPSKVGRLIRLGDFAKDWDSSGSSGAHYEGLVSDSTAGIENYGLHYFKFSNESDLIAAGVPTNFIAFNDGDDIDVWDLTSGDEKVKTDVISSLDTSAAPVYHSVANRLYVSDANLKNVVDPAAPTAAEISRVTGIIDRPRLYPYTDGSSVSYNITANTATLWFTETISEATTRLYQSAPIKGATAGNILVVGTQADSTALNGLPRTAGFHHGIYININFEDITTDVSGTGWGGTSSTGDAKIRYYKFFSSFLYDDGSETKLTDVTSSELITDSKNRDFGSASDWAVLNIAGGSLTEPSNRLQVVTSTDNEIEGAQLAVDKLAISLVVGNIYRIYAKLDQTSGASTPTINFALGGGTTTITAVDGSPSDSTIDTTEQLYYGDVTAANITGLLQIYNTAHTSSTTFTIDDISVVELSGSSNVVVKATTTDELVFQALVVKQVYIDATEFRTNFPRVHGARFYYTEVNSDGDLIGNDKYLWAELDFRYGFKLTEEFGHWSKFLQITGSDGGSTDEASIQVVNAYNNDITPSTLNGTLSSPTAITAFTYYALNLFYPEELKEDLMWKVSTVGNGIAFIGNIKYDNRYYTDTMIYSGAGETDAGSAYPMWGTFPVDSNRIDIPGAAGEITALKWVNNRVLQFRENAMYIVNVEEVLAPKVEGVYQGMGVAGQWAVTETPFGIAWVNENGAYAYNAEQKKARSLTIGRLDTEDFGADSTSKIGYDDRVKMLIIGNWTRRATDGYHYAYSFITDAWCTWNVNANSYTPKSNFAIDSNGYLTGGTQSNNDLVIYKWSAVPSAELGIDYITKDIDMGKPSLDKRFYTLYISYTGGGNQANMYVYFRVNGLKGSELTNGWTQLKTIQDYTDPYGSTNATAWDGSSGSPTTGDTTIGTADDLDSSDEVASTGAYEQKLAKINLRTLVASSGSVDDTVVNFDADADRTALPVDYLKFARSIQFRIKGTAATTFEINDISLVFKEKRLK